jgi:putative ABC transport system substrate-binding protein
MKKQAMYRLIFVLLILLLTMAACGQDGQSESFTVGVVNLAPVLDPVFEGFKENMTALGYVEGENITYIYDGPVGQIDLLEETIQGLVDAEVDLILALSTPAALTSQRVTQDIPIVFAPISDPIQSGLVTNLSQPGGNSTGITWGVSEPRRLEWLLEIVPGIEKIYVPYNPEDPSPSAILANIREVAPQFGVELVIREARNEEEITEAINNIPDDVDAVFLLPDNLLVSRMSEFSEAAIEKKLPLSAPGDETVADGGLMSYSMRFYEAGEQAARLADQIFKGADPGSLPVETTEFFLSVNLITAEAIGVEIEDDVLEAADDIIR